MNLQSLGGREDVAMKPGAGEMRPKAVLQVPGGGQEQEEEGSSVAALTLLTETARHECGWDLAIWRPLGTLTCTGF